MQQFPTAILFRLRALKVTLHFLNKLAKAYNTHKTNQANETPEVNVAATYYTPSPGGQSQTNNKPVCIISVTDDPTASFRVTPELPKMIRLLPHSNRSRWHQALEPELSFSISEKIP